MKYVVSALLCVVPFLAACSTSGGPAPAASPAFTPQAQCERNGGWWHPDSGICEYPAPQGPR